MIELLGEKRQAVISHAVTKGLDPSAPLKPSGVEWLGDVPVKWKILRLGFECRTHVPMRDKPESLDGAIPWIRIEDFDGKYITRSKSGQGVTPATVAAMNLKVLPEGAVLCSCSCSMGVAAIVAHPLVTNQTFIGIVPGNRVRSDYLYYYFNTIAKHLDAMSTGAIQTYLSRNDFQQIRFPGPSVAEQRSIAEFLDRETAKIDGLVSEAKNAIELLRERRSALISAAVTGQIDVRPTVSESIA